MSTRQLTVRQVGVSDYTFVRPVVPWVEYFQLVNVLHSELCCIHPNAQNSRLPEGFGDERSWREFISAPRVLLRYRDEFL